MQAVSAGFLPALSTDHGMVAQVDVLYDGALVAENIAYISGSVSVDADSDTRRSLTLTIPDPADFPLLETDRYAPYGQELFAQRGIQYINGVVEMVPLGFFVITDISGDIHTGPLTITASGREYLIKSEPFETATSTGAAVNTAAFIAAQLEAVIPGVDLVDASTLGTNALATATWDAGADRWAALQEVAKSVGCELFVNAEGSFMLRDIPDINAPSTSVVWSVDAGDGGVLVAAQKSLSADGVYNRVIVRGENSADDIPPVSGTATLTDPTDPLRYGGPFGKRTKSYSSSLVTTSLQAQGVANGLLRTYRAPNRTVTVSSIPNPALDAGDCIRVSYGPGHDPELFLVRSFSVPLDNDSGDFQIETVSGKEDDSA